MQSWAGDPCRDSKCSKRFRGHQGWQLSWLRAQLPCALLTEWQAPRCHELQKSVPFTHLLCNPQTQHLGRVKLPYMAYLLAAITAAHEHFVLAWRVVPSTQEIPNDCVEEWAREGEGVRDVVVQAHHAGLRGRPGFDEREEVLGREAG